MDEDPAQNLVRMMGEARDVIARLRDREQAEDEEIEIIGVGSSEDGHVSLVLDRSGKVESLALDRHARGLGSEVLAAQILAAYKVARQDLQHQLQEQIQSGGMADPYEANEKLIEAQSNALKQSLGMIENFNATMNRISRAAGTDD